MSSSDPPPPAKLSFGFSKHQAARRLDVSSKRKEDVREEITAIEGGVLKTAAGQPAPEAKQYIVPKLENTFQTGVGNKEKASKKFTPSFKPPDSGAPVGDSNERFEAAKEDTRPKIVEYGLQKRVRPDADGERKGHQQQGGDGRAGNNKSSFVPPAKLEEAALERDVQILPEEASVEAYEDMPIEEFGKAMLRGMGWTEGMGVGRNRKQAQPIEYLRRPERLGLGASAAPDKDAGKKKVVKMGDKPVVNRSDLVLPPDADGRQRHIRTLDEKLVHRSEVALGPRPGKVMQVVGGRHKGLACRVMELLPQKENRSSYASVRLLLSNEAVDVRCSDLAEAGQQQQEEAGRPELSSRSRSSRHADKDSARREGRECDEEGELCRDGGSRKEGRRRGDEMSHNDKRNRQAISGKEGRRKEEEEEGARDSKRRLIEPSEEGGRCWKEGEGQQEGSRVEERSSEEESEEEEETRPLPKRSWLAPYIKVRVVDKRVRGGRLYLKKGTVVDVHPGGVCDVAMDEGNDVLQLGQAALETVVPKELGAAVLVVEGPFRGHKARVQAKTAEACAVQLESDLTVQRLLLDEVAMYVGPMDDD